ncbi:GntR family transcriptional regulator [Nocardia neocaledoniensis NBRC 108232]|uniref:GntR family transcriptional regulator n=1 Tax=Nocardia neocaledoniensis TaxID=236511 RepID=A0A317N100_9NOCA|nr:GntR family transcriptional regulator [Nocardia neocaledoniensis]PWV67564.1 GntR family transcriptional regulator [Nocardia neocaledoniensis]GEM31262.1 GntR family transcriptional regulator [Nocardia neocaledoniensis NBRC 108232]
MNRPTGVPPDRRNQPLLDEVTAYIREMIMSGQIAQGEHVRPEPIAGILGVSNTPIREALLTLRGEGLIELVPRRGFIVASVSENDVRDLFWSQAVFASELAARAALVITPEQIVELERIDAAFEQATHDGDTATVAELGHRFHRIINLAAASHQLTVLLDSVVKRLPNRFYASMEAHVASSRDDHRGLVRALADQDAGAARAITQRHILDSADTVLAILGSAGVTAEVTSA